MNARTFTVTTLAALLAVLTLASSVSAQCGWMLWREWVAVSNERQPAGTTRTASRLLARTTSGRRARSLAHATPQGYIGSICLPDTVDPRGPKASGR